MNFVEEIPSCRNVIFLLEIFFIFWLLLVLCRKVSADSIVIIWELIFKELFPSGFFKNSRKCQMNFVENTPKSMKKLNGYE